MQISWLWPRFMSDIRNFNLKNNVEWWLLFVKKKMLVWAGFARMDVISAGPTGRSLRTLNNKNNLAGLYLKKRLDQYKREKTFIISHIDRDRFDTKDFLQQIHKIESDNNEAAVQ